MSLQECLDRSVQAGEITKQEAGDLIERYNQFRQTHEVSAPAQADRLAQQDLVTEVQAQANRKKRNAQLSAKALMRIDEDLEGFRDQKGNANINSAALDILEHHGTIQHNGRGIQSVEANRKAIIASAHAKMEAALIHFERSKIKGDLSRKNKVDLPKVLAEAMGENTGDPLAKAFAVSWIETSEWLRQRFNAAGGDIGKLDNWGLPQHHNRKALIDVGRDSWVAYVRDKLDHTRMKNPLTGNALTNSELDDFLKAVHKNVTSDGTANTTPTTRPNKYSSVANRHAEQRQLVFKSSKEWFEYQQEFGGGGDVFASMMGHINMMARDIAHMEKLGPNPSTSINYIKNRIDHEAGLKEGGEPSLAPGTKKNTESKAKAAKGRVDAVWGSMRGTQETAGPTGIANFMAGTRNLITANALGSAQLSAISDVAFGMVTRKFAGMSSSGTVKQIANSFNDATRQEAINAGLILDSAMNVMHTQARYVGTLNGPKITQYVADRVLAYSFLTPWTQASKHAFGLAYQNNLAQQVKKSFDELDDLFRGGLERYGITANEWDQIRKAKIYKSPNGLELLRPNEIGETAGQALAEKYIGMIIQETTYAVPESFHRARTMLLNESQAGTFGGEILRSMAQFKSFGVAFAMLHGARTYRMLTHADTAFRNKGLMYLGSVVLASTIFGALSIQLKQVAAGRDPRDVTTKEFWGAALLQGGGLGIYGDFLFSNLNRYGSGLSQTIAGPTAGTFGDFLNLTLGNIAQLAIGDETNFGRELSRFIKSSTPGSNLWYARLALERMLFDQIQYLADPEANDSFKRRNRYWQRSTGQEFFWKPGDFLPDRLPDPTQIAGE